MDINLMPACDIIGCNEKILKDIDYCELEKIIKEIQRNAIEVAVQRCRQDAKMTYNFYEDESYIDIISILGCKQKLFEENNL